MQVEIARSDDDSTCYGMVYGTIYYGVWCMVWYGMVWCMVSYGTNGSEKNNYE